MRRFAAHVRRALLCAGVVSLASVAAAQGPPPQDPASLPPTELGIKYRLSLMASGGLDLDVFGEVVTFGLSCDNEITTGPTACNQQTRIVQVDQLLHYPDVYIKTQRRLNASAGFGIFQKDEIIVQVSRSSSAAEPDIRLGNYITGEGTRPLRATFTTYKDQSIEAGLRHYLRAVGRSKSYVNLLYGKRMVEAITADLTASGNDGNIGTVRFYDKATLNTAAIVFGVTYEKGIFGGYLEAGFRWTAKLAQQDDDLSALGVAMINDTASRIFMPANIGVLVRF
jgi:hypothetical protein